MPTKARGCRGPLLRDREEAAYLRAPLLQAPRDPSSPLWFTPSHCSQELHIRIMGTLHMDRPGCSWAPSSPEGPRVLVDKLHLPWGSHLYREEHDYHSTPG